MSDSVSAPEPGWYADPRREAARRYWDGSRWTAEVRGDASEPQPPADAAPAAQSLEVPSKRALRRLKKRAPKVVSEEELALTTEQRTVLSAELTAGTMLKRAWQSTLAFAGRLIGLGTAITALGSQDYLFGIVILVWGIVVTVGLGIVALMLTPFVALGSLPVLLLTRRPKLRRDLAGGRAVRQSGTFRIEDGHAGRGTVTTGRDRLTLSPGQLQALRAVQRETSLLADERIEKLGAEELSRMMDMQLERESLLEGSIVRTPGAGLVLGAYDRSGRELFGAAA